MASQGDIRRYEQERAMPPPPAPAPFPPLGEAPGGASTLPLGAKLPQVQTTSPAMEQAVGGILQGQKDLNARLPILQGDVETRRAALGAELEQPMPERPNLHAIPQFQPRQVSGEEMTMFAGIAMALAGLGTRALRGNTAMAFNAAAEAMKGFNTGNLQQARLDLENFKRQFDSVIAENQRMNEEYRSIIESRRMSLQQKEQALRVAAAARDDQLMLAALQQGQLKQVFDLEAHRINAGNQAALQATQIYERARQHAETLAAREAAARAQAQASEPLVPVQQADGSTVYVRRSQAVGQTVPPRNAGDKLTETEAKGTLFWRQMNSAEDAARQIAGEGFDTGKFGSQMDVRMAGSDWTNWAASPDAQKYAQAAEQWAEAYLRLKTGAATNQDEIRRNARAYFPQPGDNPQTIAQKAAMRAKAIEDVSIIAGRGVSKQPSGSTPHGASGQAQEGQRGKSKSGRDIIFRNGRWEYL